MSTISVDRLKQVTIGETIGYKLLPHQLPVNPERVYHGVVKKNIVAACLFIIVLTEETYKGIEDFVRYDQVVDIVKTEV